MAERHTERTGKSPQASARERIQEALRNGVGKLDLNLLGPSALWAASVELAQLRGLTIRSDTAGGAMLPPDFLSLPFRPRLILICNYLPSLPWRYLTQLWYLDLSYNQLSETELPTLDHWMLLRELDLSHNRLAALPEWLGKISNLSKLNLSGNQIPALPDWVGQMSELKRLDLSGNQLAELPERLGQLSQLVRLDLAGNQLATLPESLGQMTELRKLDLDGNRLVTLPESLGRLPQLNSLDLFSNRLTALPESVGELSQLQHLDLAGNQLQYLPETFGKLTRLQELYLDSNQLAALPESLRELQSLQALCLHGNEALGLPLELLGPTSDQIVNRGALPAKPADILDYYFRTRGGSRPLNEAKLIFVGRGGVGKTCLVNRLVEDRFDPVEKKTEGIRITPWRVRLEGQEEAQLRIWDFGGQEIMHSTHQFFLTQRSLYLLVLNGREGGEDADAEYWLQLIESFGGDSPVLVVLNKVKEHPFDLNRRALQQKYPGIRAFLPTDCEDKTGLAELVSAIRRETGRLADLRAAFPGSWFKIKDRLAGMKENYLSFERYRELCQQLGEREPEAQERLAGYLHSLGIALNFKDDPRLRETHVLNPYWITNGIYKTLNSSRLAQQKGVLRLEDLAGILDAEDYPREKHLFLLDLMKKFELCFEFPEDPQHRYLVPELLDKQEPDLGGDFPPEKCLNFHYRYNLVPEGLLPRFIVRTQVLSGKQPRWRTGVVLEFEGNRALVKADTRDRKVAISVAGPTEGRRRLLAVIRSDFEAIHGDIKKLQIEELVPVQGRPEVVIPYSKLKILEQRGKTKIDEVMGNDIVELDVREMLNGVDLEGTRRGVGLPAHEEALRVYISYSHQDEVLRNELETHLKLLQRQGLISVWTDRKIAAGEEWKGQIHENLESARIVLLLVSSDFIASDYCYDTEMKRALARHEGNLARVIPVILRDVDWEPAPFGKLQALPQKGKPVMLWDHKDSAWKDVALGIRRAVEEIRGHGR